jgi:hypothetical protein
MVKKKIGYVAICRNGKFMCFCKKDSGCATKKESLKGKENMVQFISLVTSVDYLKWRHDIKDNDTKTNGKKLNVILCVRFFKTSVLRMCC